MSDVSTAKAEIEGGKYFQAGMTVAEIITDELGPVEKQPTMFANAAPVIPQNAFPDYVSGFVFGMTDHDHQKELQSCWDHSKDADFIALEPKLAADVKSKNIDDALAQVSVGHKLLLEATANCDGMDEDKKALMKWAQKFDPKNKTELEADVAKALIFHKKSLMQDLANAKADLAHQDFHRLGIDAAIAATTVFGAINN